MTDFAWLNSTIAEVNGSTSYCDFGPANILVGFRSETSCRIVEFQSTWVSSNEDAEVTDILDRVDVLISMSGKQWKFYLRRRVSGKSPSILVFNLRNNVLEFASPLNYLKFLRFHRSVQAFLDVGCRLYK